MTSSDESGMGPTMAELLTVSVAASSEAKDAVNNVLNGMQTWEATLPFVGIEGRKDDDPPTNLFEFKTKDNAPIVFDRVLYSPDENGHVKLMTDLKRIAFQNGTNLVVTSKKNSLHCFRCRAYGSHKKRKNREEEEGEDENGISASMFDSFSVLLDMRTRTWHHDRKNDRSVGQQRSKATRTAQPILEEHRCSVSLHIALADGKYW